MFFWIDIFYVKKEYWINIFEEVFVIIRWKKKLIKYILLGLFLLFLFKDKLIFVKIRNF